MDKLMLWGQNSPENRAAERWIRADFLGSGDFNAMTLTI